MKPARFSDKVLDAVRAGLVIGIRAGSEPHRIIAVWAVVVESRVFIRSWGMKAGGWHRKFLEEPRGIMTVGERRIRVRAVQTRSARVKDEVDRAYAAKYRTPASKKYVRDLSGAKSKATTTELVPSSSPGPTSPRARAARPGRRRS